MILCFPPSFPSKKTAMPEALVTELTAVAKNTCSEALRHTCQLAVEGAGRTMDH